MPGLLITSIVVNQFDWAADFSLRMVYTDSHEGAKSVHIRLAHVDELTSSHPGLFRELGVRISCGLV